MRPQTIFGAVNPYNGKLIVDTADSGNTKTFFRFLVKCLRAAAGQKVYMVLDNVHFHHAKRLKPLLKRYRDRIELIFLPPYSPDLNPVERVVVVNAKTGYPQQMGKIHGGTLVRFPQMV
jgi:putative transposase